MIQERIERLVKAVDDLRKCTASVQERVECLSQIAENHDTHTAIDRILPSAEAFERQYRYQMESHNMEDEVEHNSREVDSLKKAVIGHDKDIKEIKGDVNCLTEYITKQNDINDLLRKDIENTQKEISKCGK
jgi:chromosome segregation ATPase